MNYYETVIAPRELVKAIHALEDVDGVKQNSDIAAQLTVAWIDAMSAARAPEPRERCEKAFAEALDEGIPAEVIFAEIALGPKTVPTRNRREYLNQMLDRLAKQKGFAPNSLATGPAPAESTTDSDQRKDERDTKHTPGFRAFIAEARKKAADAG
jgi:hypothetical protein